MELSIEERIARLEGALGIGFEQRELTKAFECMALVVLVLAVCTAFLGVGLPNHYYQPVFAILCLGLAYHREWILFNLSIAGVLLAAANVFVISAVMKIFLGAGFVQPFVWLRLPNIKTAEKEGLSDFVPSFSMEWQDVALSQLSIDFTVVQTFLLVISLIGGFFGFQPFASLTAFALVILSVPALLAFNWDWVLPTLIMAAVGLYLQSGTAGVRKGLEPEEERYSLS